MNSRMLTLTGHSLILDDIVNVARNGYKVSLDPSAVAFVERGARMVSEWANSDKVVYGINTGFGDLASVVISAEDSRKLQENLLKSHACGVGAIFPIEIVRAIMLLRVNTLIRGFSGISLEPLEQLTKYLNMNIIPVIPSQGSVGASGDLCPLSHLAITLIGLGEVQYKGLRRPTIEVLKETGINPIRLKPKEGLALNNGTTVLTAIASLAAYDAKKMVKIADIAAALSLEALHGVPYAFDARTHELRPYTGQKSVASNMRRMIEKSEIIDKYKHDRVQDAYSLRCVPQVHGASRDALDYVCEKLLVEINSVTDNPLIFPADKEAISGGNFHGQPIALAMDFFAIAMAELGNISERRVARMVDNKLSGLPPFLVEKSGLNSGFMIPQYVSASIVSENKVLAHPASVDSIPTSANQEDHVSMGAYSSRKGKDVLDNVKKVLAIEIMTGAQALEFSFPLKPGTGTMAAFDAIRTAIPFVAEDTYLHPLIMEAISLVENDRILSEVESTIGSLS